MCIIRKQKVKIVAGCAAVLATAEVLAGAAAAGPPAGGAGGLAIGDGTGGVTDRAYVVAPPRYAFVVEKARGSFLDCGDGREPRAVDADGRDAAPLPCGVTLTETVVIPAAAKSARVVVHF